MDFTLFLWRKLNMEYTKECPKCKKIMSYTKEGNLKRSIKMNCICKDCRKKETKLKNASKIYKKTCPECNEIIRYSSKGNLRRSIKNDTICEKCKKERIEKRQYTKNCPICDGIMSFTIERHLIKSIKNNITCKKCKNREKQRRPKYVEYAKTYKKKPKNILRLRKLLKERRKDPIIKMNLRISGGIRKSLKSLSLSKNGRHWESLVGYTLQDLKDHIESLFTKGMNWEKLEKGEIHIDHIIPKTFFKIKSADDIEFKMCWRLENLQPLWKKDNEDKNDKMMLWGKEVRARDIK